MAVQLKISTIKPINGSSLSTVVDLANFNFSTLKTALTEFLGSINYDDSTGVEVDIQTIYSDSIYSRQGIVVYGPQQNNTYPEVIKLYPTGTITAKNTVVEDVLEGKRLRLKVFGVLPPTGIPGEIVYINAQGTRIEGVYVYLLSTGWTLLSGSGAGSCTASITRTVVPDTVSGDGTLISSVLVPMPAPVSTSQLLLFVNGQQMLIGNGTLSAPVYFSKDSGVTPSNYGEIDSTDELYWNSSIAGYGLDSNDIVTLMYYTADPYCSSPGVVCNTNIFASGEDQSAFSQASVTVTLDSPASQTSPMTVCQVPVPQVNVPGALPAGYYLTNTLFAYDITTPLSGGAIIEFTLPQSMSQSVFDTIRIFHDIGGTYVDETILSGPYSPNYSTRKIYAQVTQFSPFFLIPAEDAITTTTTTSGDTTTTTTAEETTTTTTAEETTTTTTAEETTTTTTSGDTTTTTTSEETTTTTTSEETTTTTTSEETTTTTTSEETTTTTTSGDTTTTTEMVTTTTIDYCTQFSINAVVIDEGKIQFGIAGPVAPYEILVNDSPIWSGMLPDNYLLTTGVSCSIKISIEGGVCETCYNFDFATPSPTILDSVPCGTTTTTTSGDTTTTTTSGETTTTTTSGDTTTTTTSGETTTTTAIPGAFMMSTIGAGDSTSACSLVLDIQRYHTGVGVYPMLGDTITTDYPPTSGFDGGSQWFKILTGVIQVFSDGTVIDFQPCP